MQVRILKGKHVGKVGQVVGMFPLECGMTYSIEIQDGEKKYYPAILATDLVILQGTNLVENSQLETANLQTS
jgi:hypothetical protein